MLTTVDFDDETLFKANKVENQVLKGGLPAKFEELEPAATEQSPHGGFRVSRFPAHSLREVADTLGGRPMVWCLRLEPRTRGLTAGGATLSHRGRGEVSSMFVIDHTRIGIST
jgi:hypothetical protein